MAEQIIIKSGREKSLRRRHPWVFSGAIHKIQGKPELGATINVVTDKGEFLGVAAYSPHSQIRARIWSFTEGTEINHAFFRKRILAAQALRETLVEPITNAYRIIAGESDGLPGVTIDRYADVLVLQLLSAGASYHQETITAVLHELYPDCKIYERSDVDVRQKEGLKLVTGARHGDAPTGPIEIEENGLKINVDVIAGHKTGYYLDQRDARAAIRPYVKDKTVLNCFSYTGGFGLYAAAAGAKEVVNVDMSQPSLDASIQNLALNGLDASKVKHIKADVFTQLRTYAESGETFDVIVLDPPKFVDSKASLNRACRGYKDINRIAAKLLNPGGILFTFSCSGLLSSELFQKVVADACLDANRDLQIIARTSQAADHPVHIHYPEGWYLKGLILRAMD
ncbi:Putative SAM-dependent methyltransferase [Idiomarina sp. A28L]|uniref:class I SAM-dependent rRNA methyltransferase n=1 Tax=Idiomarina sp. A28L TaxID=1036674 RepID=UPI000213887A|nr:class I SAM-dependent methyltransferase [Idiomarina sp. A28L]EGN75726.1 Putative SAM-dependent methyltransferase [Idiomarina sp. A28L]